MDDIAISVKNICKDFATYKRGESFGAAVKSLFHREKEIVGAVRDISFDIRRGEIIGLLGENGAGKSTTIKILTGVLFPTSGQASVLGYIPYANRKRYVRHIGAVFGQKSQLIWDIPPLDSFSLNKAVYEIPEADYRRRLDSMLDILDIGEIVQKPTRVLSLGERMKCEFVMAMLHDPKVVFLDEPTIGVDIIAKDAIRGFIREKNAEGVTFILTTHDLDDIESLAGRVIVINRGEKVFEGDLETLKKYLCDKKTVRIAAKKTVDGGSLADREGISLLEQKNDREIDLLVDNAVMPIGDFIAYISGACELQDISIKELDIGTVVKSIYIDRNPN
jgi:ABC-2 type transport system ATP-binding protein